MFAFHLREPPVIDGDRLSAADEFTLRHLRAARIRQAENFVLIHEGVRMVCKLVALESGRLVARVLHREEPQRAVPRLAMALGFLEGRKVDEALFVLTQLGVDAFNVFQSERSRRGALAPRVQRWQRRVLDACEISDIVHPPSLETAENINPVLEWAERFSAADTRRFLFYESAGEEARTLTDLVAQSHRGQGIIAVVGPEGGFEPSEVAAFAEKGFNTVSLGARILEARVAAYYIASHLAAWVGKLS